MPFVIAAALHVGGYFAVTAGGNVPLDNRLAATDPAPADGARLWSEIDRTRWTPLNTIRTVSCMVAAAMLLRPLAKL